jgi:hypothetical protein
MSVRSKEKEIKPLYSTNPLDSVEIQLPTKLGFHLLGILLSHEALSYKGYVSRCTITLMPT